MHEVGWGDYTGKRKLCSNLLFTDFIRLYFKYALVFNVKECKCFALIWRNKFIFCYVIRDFEVVNWEMMYIYIYMKGNIVDCIMSGYANI